MIAIVVSGKSCVWKTRFEYGFKSSNSLFTLSKDTKKALKSAKNDVTLYYMVSNGKETDYIEKVLKQYPKGIIKVKLKKD